MWWTNATYYLAWDNASSATKLLNDKQNLRPPASIICVPPNSNSPSVIYMAGRMSASDLLAGGDFAYQL